MLLETFLKKLEYKPTEIRHDSYENKDIIVFEKKDGFFPYIEFDSTPKNKVQSIYFDVLNWSLSQTDTQYVCKMVKIDGFMKIFKLKPETQLSTLDNINKRLHAFYLLFSQE